VNNIRAALCLSALLHASLTTADENARETDPAFLPGHRFAQWAAEDNRRIGAVSASVGWAALHRRGFELDLGTGVQLMTRYEDDRLFGDWIASVALTAPLRVAPFVEIGFDLDEALAETLTDMIVEDKPGAPWVRIDRYVGAGLKIGLNRLWTLKAYYKKHDIDSDNYRQMASEVFGFALIRRYERVRLEWWQYPP
jgi:hypothetical protein